jgi:hypothetical protein
MLPTRLDNGDMIDASARQEGYSAHRFVHAHGKQILNPYEPESAMYRSWELGWNEAALEAFEMAS